MIAVQANMQSPGVEDAVEPEVAHFKLKPGPGRSGRDVGCHQRARIHSAMVEVIAEQGYDATTVRRLARKAGVSTRTFYQHYSGKEQCFLRTQELIARRWIERIAASQKGDDGGARKPFLLGARALLHAWLEWPEAARLMLVEAYSASSRTLMRSRHLFRGIAAKCRDSDGDNAETSRLISEGMIAGMVGVMGSRLFSKQPIDLEDELLDWVASCCPALSSEFLGFLGDREPQELEALLPVSSSNAELEDGALAPLGDRALLLSAVSKLAATGQTGTLTPKRISEAAGVSQRKFYAIFPCLNECLIAAVESHADSAMSKIRQQCESSSGPVDEMSRKAALLCAQISQDPSLASICFGDMGIADTSRVCYQERVVAAISTLAPDETSGIAVEASANAIWTILSRESAPHKTDRLDRAAPVLTYLLLAPAMRRSWATEVVDQRDCVAAA